MKIGLTIRAISGADPIEARPGFKRVLERCEACLAKGGSKSRALTHHDAKGRPPGDWRAPIQAGDAQLSMPNAFDPPESIYR